MTDSKLRMAVALMAAFVITNSCNDGRYRAKFDRVHNVLDESVRRLKETSEKLDARAADGDRELINGLRMSVDDLALRVDRIEK